MFLAAKLYGFGVPSKQIHSQVLPSMKDFYDLGVVGSGFACLIKRKDVTLPRKRQQTTDNGHVLYKQRIKRIERIRIYTYIYIIHELQDIFMLIISTMNPFNPFNPL